MDWVAIGAIATAALVVVGYLQVRAITKTNAGTSLALAGNRHAPVIHYRVYTGSGSYPLPEFWKADVLDERYTAQAKIEIELKYIRFAFIQIINRNQEAVGRISLDYAAGNAWSAVVEDTDHISKQAVKLSLGQEVLRIDIPELPASDTVTIAVCGPHTGYGLSSANAAITLKRLRD